MTDVTQGDDQSLFSDATTTTLEKFENAEIPLPPEKTPEVVPPKEPPKGGEPPRPDQPDPMVPSQRLREETEAKRRVERERDDLLRQLATRPPPQAPAPQKSPDVFENPSGFVQSEVKPFFERMQQEMQMQREAFSQQMAVTSHGGDKVQAARQALEQGMSRGDQDAWGAYNRAMQSAHPYDVITRWHLNNETMREVGGDLAAFKQRIRDEAKSDPEYQRQVIEASKGNAHHVARPVTSSPVPKIPSLGNVGAGAGGETDLQEPSDEQLFRAATSAKRR